jgi:putative oxidoreductase
MKTKMFFSKYDVQVYSIFRIIVGFLFLWHGSQKLFAIPHAAQHIPEYIVLIAGPIEFFGGFLVMIGLFTRWTAFICSGEMAYAYWTVHSVHALLPILNGGELAVLYCFLFLYISSKGSGIFSIDHILEMRKKNKS